MVTEIDVKIIIDTETATIMDTYVQVSAAAPIMPEAVDLVLADTFYTLYNRISQKICINNKSKKDNLN